MSIPYVAGTLRGWTKKTEVYIVTKTVVNHLTTQYAQVKTWDLFIAPLQPEKIRRKPEEQRSWKWFDLVVKVKKPWPYLTIDSGIIVDGIQYRIDSRQPWNAAGYQRYEATEDYSGTLTTFYKIIYNSNGAESGTVPETYAYNKGGTALAQGNTGGIVKEGYTFNGWNTAANGSGTAYAVGATITMGSDNVILYAQWVPEAST